MRSNYKLLGSFIQKVDIRNRNLQVDDLRGLSMTKKFRKSTSNIVGTDMSRYKIVEPGKFACDFMSVIRVHKLPVVLNSEENAVIVSPAYTVFEVIDESKLLPEYLMMWFRRTEFDRYADFKCDSAIRGGFTWDELCEVELSIPSLKKQEEIINEYNTVINRISLNEELNQKLEDTAQTLYKNWFIDFEFPIHKDYAEAIKKPELEGKPYKSNGGIMHYNEELENEIPQNWRYEELKLHSEKIGSGSTPRGGKTAYEKNGISLVRSMNIYDYRFSYKDLAFINESQAEKLENVALKKNDILINITGVSVTRCCIIPENILPARVNQHVAIVRTLKESDSTYYFLSALCSSNIKMKLMGISESGSTRQALTKSDLETLKLIIPSPDYLSKFNILIKKLFDHRNLLERETENLKELRELLQNQISIFSENS